MSSSRSDGPDTASKTRQFSAGGLRRALAQAPGFNLTWYLQRYPHVAAAGWHPVDHFLTVGLRAGHAPNAGNTPGLQGASGIQEAVHRLVHATGAQHDIWRQQNPAEPIHALRLKLLSMGFTEKPLAELEALSHDPAALSMTRALAARELALWHMRARTVGGYQAALRWLETASVLAAHDAEPEFRSRLRVAELLCLHHLGRDPEGCATYERAAIGGEVDDDVILARATLANTPGERLTWINAMLGTHRIPPLALMPESHGASPYDRLTTAAAVPQVDGPMVTVLIAAYQAGATLHTALRALQEQSWKNLEILVLDDCSPGPETARVAMEFAARDPRIRLIRMAENAGAYVARSRGLAEAAGDYVTLHDADDWAHPQRIEIQMTHMLANPSVIGCLSLQARMRSDLRLTRWTGDGHFLIPNTSSFLFRRDVVRRDFGGWDPVRISADNELIRRIRHAHGQQSVVELPGPPLAFQRDSETSVVADEFLGINGFLYGARRAYAEAQAFHRSRGGQLDYSDTQRPFPVPALLRADRPAAGRHVPVVLGSEFRMQGGSVNSCIEEMRFHRRHGLALGLVELFRYDLYAGNMRTNMLNSVREMIDGDTVQQLVFGEHVRCDLLLLRYPPCLWHDQRYLPRIEAREIKVIVNQPPMSDYSAEGVVRYDIGTCAANIRRWFGKDATWHPIGPLVRDALVTRHADELHHVTLAREDWHNIIDLGEWAMPAAPRLENRPLRIGRHARDHMHKWPASAADILAAYPTDSDVEVHVLGGADTAAARLGGIPPNWVVHPFGSIHPRDFLADIDVWIYFAHPDWVESFGRTIIEAMAAGVPVILPETYRPVFGEAALYATPQTAVGIARRLMADPDARAVQIRRARELVSRRFSHESHKARLVSAGVTFPGA